MYTTLIDCPTLARHLGDPNWILVDCRFSLAEPPAGEEAYQTAHIPGAVYAHLEHDLSGPPVTDRGRHPLPTPAALTALFSRLGIAANRQVVVYDDFGGAIAARLWWMLHYMGHEAAAVLDGGWPAWQALGLPTRGGVEENAPAGFQGQPRLDRLVLLDQVPAAPLLVDSREGARYRGEVEPIDPRPGHIPGAVNYPFQSNLTETQRFRPVAQLRQQLLAVLGDQAPEDVVYYCGSGVTACHNLLAQLHAGLPEGKLYVGSWSEWSADPGRASE